MAIYKIFPEKDSSIYTEFPNLNVGLDEILECSTYISQTHPQVSRCLVKFSTSEINNILETKISSSNFATYLKIFSADLNGLNLDSELDFYPISGSWGMGTGHYTDYPSLFNGVSWYWQDYSGSNLWQTSSFDIYATASYSSLFPGGGTWYTGSSLGLNIVQTQSFSYSDITDINVDVTNTILTWYSGGIPNEGFIIKFKDDQEFINNPNSTSNFKFFSIDTHTIYPPQLEFRWNDYSFSTGSSSNKILDTSEALISLYNNVGTYYSESVPRMRIGATPKYPNINFSTSSAYNTNYYLPESQSWYSIKDSFTNEYVIDFDPTYTLISADATSSYFDLYMSGLEPERYYTVLIKTIINGETIIFDNDLRFKISN